MAFPKVLLCRLGTGVSPEQEERALRSVGFAVASVAWSEINEQPRSWMQLASPLSEKGLKALVIAGKSEDFTADVVSSITMLSLALKTPLPTACVLLGGGDIQLPPLLKNIRILRQAAWAAKVMALCAAPGCITVDGFHIRTHLSPFTGQWLEIGPNIDATWTGFMVGVTGAEVGALGVGPRGQVPLRCTLHYPQIGIVGDLDGQPFHACAAQNVLNAETACYVRVDGHPQTVFVTESPELADKEQSPVLVLRCV